MKNRELMIKDSKDWMGWGILQHFFESKAPQTPTFAVAGDLLDPSRGQCSMQLFQKHMLHIPQ